MRVYKVIVSKEAPNVNGALWAKPVEGGFALYLLEGKTWKPQVIMDDNDTAALVDDVVADSTKKLKSTLIGKSNDTKSANTINGAKKYADDAVANLIKSGTFANKPDSPSAGDMYFCTNKQTTEGAADGIMIYYNGTDWVDALGRTVS